jgi:hypothetical protein
LNSIAEAGEKPDLDTAPDIDNFTTSTGEQPAQQSTQQPAQELTPEVQNLRKQLNDLSAKLWQLNQQSIQGGKYESTSNIAKALLESFDIFEADDTALATQRAQLTSQITNIIKKLEPYKSNPDVAQDIERATRGMQAPVKPATLNSTPIEPSKTTTTTNKPASVTKPVAKPVVQKQTAGKFDPQVQKVQKALQANGYDIGPRGADGNLGSKTMGAMQAAGISGISDADIAKIKKSTSQTTTSAPTGTSGKEQPTPTAQNDVPVIKPEPQYGKTNINDYNYRDFMGAQPKKPLSDQEKLQIINSPKMSNNGYTARLKNKPDDSVDPFIANASNASNVYDKAKAGYNSGGIPGALSGMGDAAAQNWKKTLGIDDTQSNTEVTGSAGQEISTADALKQLTALVNKGK